MADGDGPRKATLLQAIKMVLSAFVGIRKHGDHQKVYVTPVQIIITGVIAAVLFVLSVITVVRLVTR